MMIKIMIIFILGMIQVAQANEDLQKEKTCVVGQSYIPPVSHKHPHIIKSNSI